MEAPSLCRVAAGIPGMPPEAGGGEEAVTALLLVSAIRIHLPILEPGSQQSPGESAGRSPSKQQISSPIFRLLVRTFSPLLF